MPTTRAQSRIVNRAQLIESPPLLLALPTEIRLEIYGYLLLPEFCVDGEGQASAEAGDPLDIEPADANHENSSGLTYNALLEELSSRSGLANLQQPTSGNRKTFSQLLVVCKAIHREAAPLFFRKATFFIREPFAFANTFLRKLAHDKIYSLRSLELRMTYMDFGSNRSRKSNPKIKVLCNLLKTFHTYNKELSSLDSVTLTLVVKDSVGPTHHASDLFFRPHNDSLPWWADEPVDCMWEAGRALAKMMRVADFELFQSVEDVYEKVLDSRYLILKGTVARVKLQRTQRWSTWALGEVPL
jgi:hypothetical protein